MILAISIEKWQGGYKNKEAIEEVTNKKEELDSKIKSLEDKKNEIDTLNKEVEASLSELDGKKKEQEVLVNNAKEEKSKFDSEYLSDSSELFFRQMVL